jgi:hypothetical protein
MVSGGAAFISSMAIGVHIMPPVIVAAKDNHIRLRRSHIYVATVRADVSDTTG